MIPCHTAYQNLDGFSLKDGNLGHDKFTLSMFYMLKGNLLPNFTPVGSPHFIKTQTEKLSIEIPSQTEGPLHSLEF